MSNRVRNWGVLALLLLTVACTRLDAPVGPKEGGVDVEQLAQANAIPAEWGELVTVVTRTYPRFVMFFEDERGTIRFLVYDAERRQLLPNTFVVRRN